MTAPARPTCFRCGEPITPGARFCMKCGSDVSGEQGSAATAMMPASAERDANEALLEVLRQATLGEYEIHKELGRGGMATVYLAHDIALDRKVAVKVMSPALLLMGEGMAERFKREARTAANLSHPNIIPIYTVKSAGKTLFFVMKFIAGRSLESIIHEIGPMPIPVVKAVLQQVGNALGYAHRNGIVHRDVKPANIMIDEEGWPVVTDFGIAKVAENRGLTMTGIAVGTPSYMSPEQCAAKDITGKSDQYSLGVVAYEMLTGKQPFEGDSAMSIMFQHFHEQPKPLRDVRADTPPALAEAVMRMLEKSPDKRWGSMEEAMAALGAQPLAHDDPEQINLIAVVRRGSNRESLRGTTPPTSPVPPARPRPSTEAQTTPIPAARIVGLTVSPGRSDLHIGDTLSLKATPRVAGGTSVGGKASWSSSDPAIASVADDGLVTAHGLGAVVITATCEGVRGTAEITVLRVPVASVLIEPAEPSLPEGATLQLVARLRDHQGVAATDREVRWSATPGGVVELTQSGLVTAVREGVVEVLAESEGISGSARIRVVPRPVASVRLAPAEGAITVGETLTLVAHLADAEGGKLQGRDIVWRSASPQVASVSDRGMVTGLADGSAEISAECEGQRVVARVKVTPVAVGSVTVAQPESLIVGERVALVAAVKDARGRPLSGRTVKWASSSPGVATVTQDGQLTGMSAGSARITAESESKSWTVTVTVQPVPVAEVVLEGVPSALAVKGSATLKAVARDAKGAVLAGRQAKWQSSRDKVATVTANGEVSARAPGQAVITATIEGKSASATVEVAAPVAAPASPPSAVAASEVRTEVMTPVSVAPAAEAAPWIPAPVPAPRAVPAEPVTVPGEAESARPGGKGKLIGALVGLVVIATVAFAVMRGRGGDPIPPAPEPPVIAVAPVQSVAVAGVNGPVSVGRTLQLSALVKGPSGEELSSREITWTSSDPGVAEVTPVGAVTARKPGTATITAQSEGKSGSVTISVAQPTAEPVDEPAAVASVSVSGPGSVTLDVGETAQLRATLKDGKGQTLTDRTVVWTTSDPKVVVAASSGVVTAVGAGAARVVANSEGRSAEVRFTVKTPPRPEPPPAPVPVAVQSVTLTPQDPEITVGGAVQLSASVLDAGRNTLTDRTVAWRSSDDRIARVDQQGGVSGVSKGTATITATVEGKSATTRVSVSVATVAVATVVINASSRNIKVGESSSWTAVARDKGGKPLEGRAFTWSSSAPAIASVTAQGVVTGVAAGTAEIWAESEGKRAPERLTVVAAPAPVTVVPTPTPAPGPEPPPATTTAASMLPRRGVEAGGALSCGIAASGAVCWGAGESALTAIGGTAGITALVVGRAHACGLLAGGRAVCWGDNRVGQLGDGGSASSTSAVEVAGGLSFTTLTAGTLHTCGLAGGKAYCWGRGRDGQLGDGSISDRKRPVAVRGGRSFTAISAGGDHTCALTAAGQAHCWGEGFSGQLGFGAQETQREPIDVSGGLKMSRIAAGGKHTCALTTGGKAYCWGANESGQVGDGSKSDRSVPAEVAGSGSYSEIASGASHSCALDAGGALFCWGENKAGQLGDGSKSNRDKPTAVTGGRTFASVSTGEGHTCGMTRSGEAVCWGRNDKGQLGDGGTAARSEPGPVRQR